MTAADRAFAPGPVREARPAPEAASSLAGPARAAGALARIASRINNGPAVTAQLKLAQTLSRPPAHHFTPREPVIQARLYRGRDEIALPERQADASPIVRSLIQSPTGYVLRATSHLTDPVVHTLRRDQKYLLGERHDQSNWAERSAGWDVDTMIEAGKAIPEQPRAALGHATRTNQPLESSHAYTVAAVLQWRTSFTSWRENWAQWKRARNGEIEGFDDEALERELAAMQDEHSSDDEKKSGHDDEHHALLAPHDDLEQGHGEGGEDDADLLEFYSTARTQEMAEHAYDELDRWAGQLQGMIAQQLHFIDSGVGVPGTPAYRLMARELPAMHGKIDALMKRIRLIQTVGDALDAQREQLFDKGFADADAIMNTLTLLFAAAAAPDISAESRTDLAARAKGTVPLAPTEGITLTNPAREAAMIRNINAARAPLLVKIGNEHVARVTAGVHGGVAVPLGKDFDQMTRQPGGEERNPLGYLGMALGAGLLVGGAIAGATLLGGGLLLGGLIAGGLGLRNRNRTKPGELA